MDFEPKLPFYAFITDKLTHFLKNVNSFSLLTQLEKRNIITLTFTY